MGQHDVSDTQVHARTKIHNRDIFQAVIARVVESCSWVHVWANGFVCNTKDSDITGRKQDERRRVWFQKQNKIIIIIMASLDEDVVRWRWGWVRRGREGPLAPQAGVVAVQAGAQWAACHKELGAWLVVAVGVHRVGEGMNVRKVTPPRLVMILGKESDKIRGKVKHTDLNMCLSSLKHRDT